MAFSTSYLTPTNEQWKYPRGIVPPPAAIPTGGGLYPSTPNPGKGAFGEVPGSVDIPESVSGGIRRDLSGILSPEVQSKLQNIAATWGIKSGMPGSGLQSNRYAHDYLGASDVARQRGFENWKSLVPLQQQNNELAAAPNPTQRALTEQSFAQQMFNQYLAAMRGGGNGGGGGGYRSPAGGTGAMAEPTRTGGIDAVANPLPGPAGNTMVNGGDEFQFYPEMWDGLLGGNGEPSMGTAPAGTYYDPGTDTSNAPTSSFDDQYWNDIFGMG